MPSTTDSTKKLPDADPSPSVAHTEPRSGGKARPIGASEVIEDHGEWQLVRLPSGQTFERFTPAGLDAACKRWRESWRKRDAAEGVLL